MALFLVVVLSRTANDVVVINDVNTVSDNVGHKIMDEVP